MPKSLTFEVHPVLDPSAVCRNGCGINASTVRDGANRLQELARKVDVHVRTVLSSLLPGWPEGGEWFDERAEAADNSYPNIRFKSAVRADRWDALHVYVMFTGQDDLDASNHRGVYGMATCDRTAPDSPPSIILRVQDSAEDRVLPTVTHELVHYARWLIRPETRDPEAGFAPLERMFQEGLAERLVFDRHSCSEVIHGGDSLSQEARQEILEYIASLKMDILMSTIEYWLRQSKRDDDPEPQEWEEKDVLREILPVEKTDLKGKTNALYSAGFKVVGSLLARPGVSFPGLLRWGLRSFMLAAEQVLRNDDPPRAENLDQAVTAD